MFTAFGEVHIEGRSELHGTVVGTGILRSPSALSFASNSIAPSIISGRPEPGSRRSLATAGKLPIDSRLSLHSPQSSPASSVPDSVPGTLTLDAAVEFHDGATVVGAVAGNAPLRHSKLLITRSASLNGILAPRLIGDFRPNPADAFAILEAASISGQFKNAPHEARLPTIDGFGSFMVTYTSTNVVLSAFQANPNPPPSAPATLQAPAFFLDTLSLTVSGSPGRYYTLQSSTNLINWLPLGTNNVGPGGFLRFDVPRDNAPHRFFRALGR